LLIVQTVCGVFLVVTIWTTMHQLFGF
jgi:hypothetical protein